jgi:hypothetical protein
MQAVKAAPEKEILPKMQERKDLSVQFCDSFRVKEHSVKTVGSSGVAK